MKKVIILLVHFFVVAAFAQSINQFDTDGKRHGIWKKNFENTQQLRYEGEFIHGKEMFNNKVIKISIIFKTVCIVIT